MSAIPLLLSLSIVMPAAHAAPKSKEVRKTVRKTVREVEVDEDGPLNEEWWEDRFGGVGERVRDIRRFVERRVRARDPFAAGFGEGEPLRDRFRPVDRFFKGLRRSRGHLELSDAQLEKLDRALYNYRLERIRLQAEMDAAWLGVRTYLRKSPPAFAPARKELKKLTSTIAKRAEAGLKAVEKAYGLLSAEQKEKLKQIRED